MIPQPSTNKLIIQLLGPSGPAGSTPIGIGLDELFADTEQGGLLPGAEYTFDMRVPRWWLEAELSRLSTAEQPLGAANADPEPLPAAQNASPIPVPRLTSSSTTIVRYFELSETETTFISPWKSPPKKYMDFMKFPPEIRNMIYELLLELGEPIPITSPALGRGSNRRLKRHFTGLFGVSKKIGEEARTTFYSCNTWVVGNGQWGSRRQPNRHVSMTAAQYWLRSPSPERFKSANSAYRHSRSSLNESPATQSLGSDVFRSTSISPTTPGPRGQHIKCTLEM